MTLPTPPAATTASMPGATTLEGMRTNVHEAVAAGRRLPVLGVDWYDEAAEPAPTGHTATIDIVAPGSALISVGGANAHVWKAESRDEYMVTINGSDVAWVKNYRSGLQLLATTAGITGRIAVEQENEVTGAKSSFTVTV